MHEEVGFGKVGRPNILLMHYKKVSDAIYGNKYIGKLLFMLRLFRIYLPEIWVELTQNFHPCHLDIKVKVLHHKIVASENAVVLKSQLCGEKIITG